MEDPPRSLPDDVLEADVLRRLPPRTLAVSRSVCKVWRAAIDTRRMLQPDLLPLSVGGIFVSLGRLPAPPMFFAPPSSSAGRRKVDSKVQTYDVEDCDDGIPTIFGCCNGLLLLAHHVVNPGTRQSARVPPCPAKPPEDDNDEYHLLFDPSLSPQYEVVVIQDPHDYRGEEALEAGSEWPPSPCIMWVYSSATGRWEKRPFAREGDAAGTLAEVQSAREPDYYRHAVYCHGALYAHCKGDFVMRITLSDYKYQVIKLPEGVNASVYSSLHLVKSKYGVYLAYIHDKCQLRVWFLNEFSGKTEWALKYDINLQPVDAHFSRNHDYPINRPCWIIHGGHSYSKGNKRQAKAKNKLEWDFDNGNIIKIEGTDEKCHGGFASILGLHPYKELAFLWLSKERVVACHLDGSKIQDLGHFHVPHHGGRDLIDNTFVYTPCWNGELFEHN